MPLLLDGKPPIGHQNSEARSLSGGVLGRANGLLQAVGLALVPRWRLQWWTGLPRFQFRGQQFVCFFYPYNCGFPPWRMTERAVELALADWWLQQIERNTVYEVGAVTPYYWPGRVPNVIDPFDTHPQVTDRKSVFATNLTGRNVLAVSTLEHIGGDEYGDAGTQESSFAALNKITSEAMRFLVTVPFGYNQELDATVFAGLFQAEDVTVSYLSRSSGNDWREVAQRDARVPPRKGPYSQDSWANSIAVIERGGLI